MNLVSLPHAYGCLVHDINDLLLLVITSTRVRMSGHNFGGFPTPDYHSHTRTDVWQQVIYVGNLLGSLPHAYGCLDYDDIDGIEYLITPTRVLMFAIPFFSFSSLIVCVAISQPISNVKCYLNTTLQRIQINLPTSVRVDHATMRLPLLCWLRESCTFSRWRWFLGFIGVLDLGLV